LNPELADQAVEFSTTQFIRRYKMEIPLQAQVECTDGVCGRSEYVLINPITDQITHLVVKEATTPNTEYLVPVDFVTTTITDAIQLRCSKAELEKMDPFIQTRYIQEKVPDYAGYHDEVSGIGSSYYLPYVSPEVTVYESRDFRQIPMGESAVQRGTNVEATDGHVGKVDEFVVNPANGLITHLVMREGHLWGKKDVIIPVSALGDTREDAIYLKLNKHELEALPTFPLQRRWS